MAIALVLERLDEAGAWKTRAFGDGSQALLQMLDAQPHGALSAEGERSTS